MTPILMAITAFLSRSPGLLNRGPGGPASLGHVPHSSIFSPTGLISNWLNFLCTELYNNLTPTLLPASVTNRTHSTRPRSRLYLDIPRPDAPVIYTGAFPILTAWPGSICYIAVRAVKSQSRLNIFSFKDTALDFLQSLDAVLQVSIL